MSAHHLPRPLDLGDRRDRRDDHAGCVADIRDAMAQAQQVADDLKKTRAAVGIALRILSWIGPDDTEQTLRASALLVQQTLGHPHPGRPDPGAVQRLLDELGGGQ